MFAQAASAREDTPGEESDVEIVAFNDVPKPSKNIDALRMQLIKLQAQLSEKMSKRFWTIFNSFAISIVMYCAYREGYN